ncbi:MAG: CoA-binding protein, partial [Theionarchaea archaeon]|nr:CoA-binding protein [Theionarchaea archaeon]
VEKFFNPDSVAVVGASRTFGKAGNVIILNLLNLSYTGTIYPVNPNADSILELKAYPSVSSIPQVVDVAVIATPSQHVPEIMKDISAKGVKRVVIISSGFAEGGREGEKIQNQVLKIAKKAGIRIIGPNTTGIMCTESMFCTSFVPIEDMPSGDVAFVAQTGLFLGVLLETIVSEEHFGISKVAGMGNKMDIDDPDILEYLITDEKTKIICFYLEGLKSKRARSFLSVAQKAVGKKPILLVKSGITEEGSRAAVSHTASLSGNDRLFTALCKQGGIIRMDDLEELVESAKAFSFQPLPEGRHVALAHYTGAGCVMGADSIVQEGLTVASLSENSLDSLKVITPHWHTLRNPVDLWPTIEKSGADVAFNTTVKALVEDSHVDSIVLAFGAMKGFSLKWPDLEPYHGKKPILIAVEGDREKCRIIVDRLEELGFPCYTSVQRAIRALRHMCEYVDHVKHRAP